MGARDSSWHISRAQRLLARHDAPIAGREITAFVVRLLDAVEHGTPDADAIEGALHDVADGPVGLAHSEPAIQHVELDEPVSTLAAAADAAARAFARMLLASQRADPVVPPPPPTAAERAALRAAFEARLPQRLADAREALSSPEWHERANAATVLGQYRHRAAADDLRRLRLDPYPQVREAASDALARLEHDEQ